MTDMTLTTSELIVGYLLGRDDFERKQDLRYESAYHGSNFENEWDAFLDWNTTCINELSAEDRACLSTLCKMIRHNNVKLVDMESCSEFQAFAFYYNEKKQLCLVNPR